MALLGSGPGRTGYIQTCHQRLTYQTKGHQSGRLVGVYSLRSVAPRLASRPVPIRASRMDTIHAPSAVPRSILVGWFVCGQHQRSRQHQPFLAVWTLIKRGEERTIRFSNWLVHLLLERRQLFSQHVLQLISKLSRGAKTRGGPLVRWLACGCDSQGAATHLHVCRSVARGVRKHCCLGRCVHSVGSLAADRS